MSKIIQEIEKQRMTRKIPEFRQVIMDPALDSAARA